MNNWLCTKGHLTDLNFIDNNNYSKSPKNWDKKEPFYFNKDE